MARLVWRVTTHRGGEVWSLHLMAASDWADFAEYHSDYIRAQRDVFWLDEPAPHEGHVSANDRPGCGFTLNETML